MLATSAHIMRLGALGRRSLQLPAASGVTKAAPLATPSCFPPRHFTTTPAAATLPRQMRPGTCIPRSLQCHFLARRTASTAATGGPAGPAGPAASARDLNWDTFFKLRKTRRRYQLACSLVTILGSAIFYTLKRGIKQPMAVKEAEFFARIKKNRVDPSVSSVGNPVPDYYGEKISSVAGYRQWMKDQRAFNKKRTSFV
ncbi:hypothetical protein PG999_006675 [Apiospora kogelbergensis]|uniref:Presequence translocated-associated motor subunit PAM17 n=1 Tax=Apiospora kogelbergensis TaxID=1337665 RepID=A0AAW0QW50_9PEZI